MTGSGVPAPDDLDAVAEQPAGPPADPATDAVITPSDPRVADALSRLSEVAQLPLAEQVEVYTDIHRRLAGVLSDPDSQA